MKAQPMNTSHYLLHPRAPLVFGTGKPLDFGLGGDSLNFPFPATVMGALRAAQSSAQGQAADPYAHIDGLNLQQLALARFNWLQADVQPALLLPRPADAVYINGKMLNLAPQAAPEDSWTDLAPGLQMLTLQGKTDDKKGKPDPAPSWWSADDYSKWLGDPKAQADKPVRSAFDTQADERTHVVIDPHGKGAVTGGLFRSTGRDFGPHTQGSSTEVTQGYALAIRTQEPQSLEAATRRLGGEGRFVRFEKRDGAQPWQTPTPPKGLRQAIRIRFILTTPAVFPEKGWYPDGLAYDPVSNTIHGHLHINGKTMVVTLLAAAITRAQSYSGWQKDEQGQPNPGRPWRVVPAGSVYWLQVTAGDAPDLWEQSLCTDGVHGQWHSNGWGRGLVGLA